ncbi:MAG: hypothetical protein ABIK73_06645 [candidate division WOR-3 bacterium]
MKNMNCYTVTVYKDRRKPDLKPGIPTEIVSVGGRQFRFVKGLPVQVRGPDRCGRIDDQNLEMLYRAISCNGEFATYLVPLVPQDETDEWFVLLEYPDGFPLQDTLDADADELQPRCLLNGRRLYTGTEKILYQLNENGVIDLRNDYVLFVSQGELYIDHKGYVLAIL